MGCTETSVSNYRYSLHNNPEQKKPEMNRGAGDV